MITKRFYEKIVDFLQKELRAVELLDDATVYRKERESSD